MPNNQTNQKKSLFAELFGKIRQYSGKKLLIGFISAVGCLIFFLWLAEEVFEGETKIFDETVRQAIHRIAAPWLTQLVIYISFLGSFAFLTFGVITALIIFLILKWKDALIILLITMAGESILEVTLKLYFQRARPEAFFPYPPLESYSFPSGHALGSFCFYGILAWLITTRLKSRGLKILTLILAAILVLLIGLSRIYLGVHFPSDVAAGFAAGFVWIFTVAVSNHLLGKKSAAN
ncbi:MAG TPA: phosphatase PAP2 family protein [Pyrinomonadaceae bacterium]|jgi:undecaprenyl-diphosphatase|nr:phosphatase PAP2 family protein [Pyrinomonadaceae bacterium]